MSDETHQPGEVVQASAIAHHRSAWITPDGLIVFVTYWGHDKAAAALGASIDELESKGWCHLSLGSVRSSYRKLTKPQIESIFDIHMMGEPTDAHYEACMASTIEAVLPLLDTL